jgi:hypothetical protein
MAIANNCGKELARDLRFLGCREINEKPFTPKEPLHKIISSVLPPADSKAG